ncbi:MAG TPA: hypothetical protein VE684_06525 [Crenalkalicoccus sp.]|jgi:hypothetical protein|nr:hypothetical protein [Crenalkalicoccus sp.]
MTRILAASLALLALAGCGRVGPPRPPGPREAITYPRPYPALDPPPAAVESRPAPPARP